jgi:hypothetical protein
MDKNAQTKPEYQLLQLDDKLMNAPVELKMKVQLMLLSGKSANLEFFLPPGQIPTRAHLLEILDSCRKPGGLDHANIPLGSRLMNKAEFVAHITKRETGMEIPLQGDRAFAPSTVEIPRPMLMHAIHGQGEPARNDVATRYLEAEAAAIDNGGCWNWHQHELDKLDDNELMNLYREITYG